MSPGQLDKRIVDQASDVPSIIFFRLFIDLGHSKLFTFIFVFFKKNKQIVWKYFLKVFSYKYKNIYKNTAGINIYLLYLGQLLNARWDFLFIHLTGRRTHLKHTFCISLLAEGAKGQLISECLFEKIVWTKILTKNLIISALKGPGQKLSKDSLVFWSKRWLHKDILKLTDL